MAPELSNYLNEQIGVFFDEKQQEFLISSYRFISEPIAWPQKFFQLMILESSIILLVGISSSSESFRSAS